MFSISELLPAERVHYDTLAKWRRVMDLVGPGDMDHHFIDSAQAVMGLPVAGHWADLGSGAGFPGISLAARFPAVQITLIESRQKRVTFLRTVVNRAKLRNAEVWRGRTERCERVFDGLISRAYKNPLPLLEQDQRLLKPGGYLVLMLGDGVFEIPKPWQKISERRYPVPDGYRRVLVLRRSPARPPRGSTPSA
jgi:16S rRNA (guanine527-N7)-methyltransferase